MAVNDPVLQRIATYPWPRGSVQARRVRGGYTLTSARTETPVARLKPLPSSDRFELDPGLTSRAGDMGKVE